MLNSIKHFSFDLWFTLIKSNPAFKKERALFFHRNFNSLKKSIEEVEAIIRQVDIMCNSINEKTGGNIDSEEMYLMVIYQMNNSHAIFESINMHSLYEEIDQLFFRYSPVVFDAHTISSLDRLKQDTNRTFNVLSNTAFIKGSSLRVLLDHLELSKYFNFQVYSDEAGISKPHSGIYNILLENIYATRKDISSNEILHVGDNPIADIHGAKSAGINAFQINTNNKIITHLFE
jgi:putative hydrolase of the HAD superfamily